MYEIIVARAIKTSGLDEAPKTRSFDVKLKRSVYENQTNH